MKITAKNLKGEPVPMVTIIPLNDKGEKFTVGTGIEATITDENGKAELVSSNQPLYKSLVISSNGKTTTQSYAGGDLDLTIDTTGASIAGITATACSRYYVQGANNKCSFSVARYLKYNWPYIVAIAAALIIISFLLYKNKKSQ
jgi:hypothetical protein